MTYKNALAGLRFGGARVGSPSTPGNSMTKAAGPSPWPCSTRSTADIDVIGPDVGTGPGDMDAFVDAWAECNGTDRPHRRGGGHRQEPGPGRNRCPVRRDRARVPVRHLGGAASSVAGLVERPLQSAEVLTLNAGIVVPGGLNRLAVRRITLVPDVATNASGVIGSFHEWRANRGDLHPDPSADIDQRVTTLNQAVWERAHGGETLVRTAVGAVAIGRALDVGD